MKKKILFGLLALALGGVNTLHAQDVTFTATGGSNYGENEGCQQALDHNLGTKWFGSGMNHFLLFEASELVQLTGYTMVTANDNSMYWRCPKEWELYGSNDAVAATDIDSGAWEHIQSVRGDNVMQHENYTAYHYAMNTSKAYKYFKVKIVYGDNGGFQISEFIPDYVKAWQPAYTAVNGVGGTGGEGYPSAFDGSVDTKVCTSDAVGMYWYVVFSTNDPVAVQNYQFTTANDSPGRNPKSWDLFAMNSETVPAYDNANWTLIDSKEDVTDFPTDYFTEVSYNVDNPTANTYKYFMLRVNAVASDQMLQFSEFKLNGAANIYTYIDGLSTNGNESPDKIFDNNTGSKWCVGSGVRKGNPLWWFMFRAGKDMAPTGYSFATGNDGPDRDPKTWKLYGINSATVPARLDGGWVLLDSKENISDLNSAARKTWVHFDIDNPGTDAYNYFKIEISENFGSNLIQFSDFQIDGLESVPENRLAAYMGFANSNLFDAENDNYNDYGQWYGTFGPADGNPVSINGYSLQSWANSNYAPKSWILYGGNEKNVPEAAWEVIDEVEENTELTNNFAFAHRHLSEPTIPYKFFKLEIKEVQGEGVNPVISEIVLHYAHDNVTPWLQINDGTAPVFNGSTNVADFTYKRTFANEWATVCLPFETQAKSGFQPYTLTDRVTDANNDYLKVVSTDEAIAPYQPTIVKAAAGAEVDFSGNNVAVYGTLDKPAAETDATGWTIVGSTTNGDVNPAEVDGTMYYIAQNKFWQADATAGVTVNAMRAYLVSDGTSPAKSFIITEDDVTGIESVSVNDDVNVSNTAVYDLQGRKVANVQRGIYIQNGKKFVVK